VVDPTFRGKDLRYLLLKHSAIISLQAGKRYILGNSEEKLLPLYQKLGMKVIGDFFEVKALKIRAKLFVGDLYEMISGKSVNGIVWNILYKDLIDFVTEADLLQMTTADKLRLAGYRLLSPISRYLERKMTSKPKKRKISQGNEPKITQ
jgi:hypothetical protein